jgi:drug/metabolite transporter (DMT)-like permease
MNKPTVSSSSRWQWLGFLMVLISASLWGISGTFGQFLFQQRGISVEWVMSVRTLCAGTILLLASAIWQPKTTFAVWKNKKDALQMLVFGLFGMMLVQYTYFAAIKHSNAATATVLQFSSPVLLALYYAIRYRRPLHWASGLAILAASIGTFLLVTHGDPSTLRISGLAFFFGIASAITLAFYTLQPMALLKKYSSLSIIGWAMIIAGLAISCFHSPWQIQGQWDDKTFYYTLFIIIFGTLIPFYLYLNAVKYIGAEKSVLLTSAEPLCAAVLSVWWLDVTFVWIDWLGALLIISTVFILAMDKKDKNVNSYKEPGN